MKYPSTGRAMMLMALMVGVLAACARTAHLYPANDSAIATGVLDLHFMSYGTGHGEIEIAMPDGEVLRGEYSIVPGGTIGFGSIIAAVHTPGGSASGYATGTSYQTEDGSPGTASAFGPKGTSPQCEYYNDNFTGHGFGGCRSSMGALYRLQY